jgi:enoyl-CoA hydratase
MLKDAFEEIDADHSVRVAILTGEGRGFCSGIDIGGADRVGSVGDSRDVFERQELVASLAPTIRNLSKPVVAAVNGAAAGGGLALALACDIRLCSPVARFNAAFVRLGLSGCDIGVSHMLPRTVGLGVASEMMLTGRIVEADEALRIGLVNRVVREEELISAAEDAAAEISRNAPFGVTMTKQVLQRNVDAPSLEAAIEIENRTQVMATRTADMPEAVSAFLDRRPPRFANR